MIAMDMAFKIAAGKQWLLFHTKPSRIMVVQTEIIEALYHERVTKYCRGNMNNGSTPIENLYINTERDIRLDTLAGKGALERNIQRVLPTVLIIDPIYDIISGGISDSSDVKKFIDAVRDIQRRYHLAIILIGHSGKVTFDSSGQEVDRGGDELLGSSYFQDWCDTMVRVRASSDEDRVLLQFQKFRNAQQKIVPIRAEVSRETLKWTVIL